MYSSFELSPLGARRRIPESPPAVHDGHLLHPLPEAGGQEGQVHGPPSSRRQRPSRCGPGSNPSQRRSSRSRGGWPAGAYCYGDGGFGSVQCSCTSEVTEYACHYTWNSKRSLPTVPAFACLTNVPRECGSVAHSCIAEQLVMHYLCTHSATGECHCRWRREQQPRSVLQQVLARPSLRSSAVWT